MELNEFGSLILENKMRQLFSDFITPVVSEISQLNTTTKKLLKSRKKTKQSVKKLNNDIQTCLLKSGKIEDINKKIDFLDSTFTSTINELKFDVSSIKLNHDSYSVLLNDVKTSMKFMEEKNKSVLETASSSFKNMREFQDTIALESSKNILAVKRFLEDQKSFNDTLSEKHFKLHQSILEINSKAFPEAFSLIEKRNVEISEIKMVLNVLQQDRVVSDDVFRLKNKVDGEFQKINERFLKELEELKSFIHQMLRLEIFCGVSDTLLQVLDSKNLKKLIPVVEGKLKEEGAIFKEESRMPAFYKPVSTDYLYSKSVIQTKNIEKSLTAFKEKIIKEEEEAKKKIVKQKLLEEQELEKQKTESQTNSELRPPSPVKKVKNYSKPRYKNLNTEQLLNEIDEFGLSSSRSSDFYLIQEQINTLKKDFSKFDSLSQSISNIEEGVRSSLSSLRSQLDKSALEFRTSLLIHSDEFKSELKQRQKETQDLQKKQERLKSILDDTTDQLDSLLDKEKTRESFQLHYLECLKIIHQLLKQDEADRKSLQLTGYTNVKLAKTPTRSKQPVTLKPECVSCTDQNSAVLSAFKMACLSYSPSDIIYENHIYSRNSMIHKLGHLVSPSSDRELSPDTEVKKITVSTHIEKRAKSATKLKNPRHLFDASFNRGLNETPSKRSDFKKTIF